MNLNVGEFSRRLLMINDEIFFMMEEVGNHIGAP